MKLELRKEKKKIWDFYIWIYFLFYCSFCFEWLFLPSLLFRQSFNFVFLYWISLFSLLGSQPLEFLVSRLMVTVILLFHTGQYLSSYFAVLVSLFLVWKSHLFYHFRWGQMSASLLKQLMSNHNFKTYKVAKIFVMIFDLCFNKFWYCYVKLIGSFST